MKSPATRPHINKALGVVVPKQHQVDLDGLLQLARGITRDEQRDQPYNPEADG